VVTRRKVHASCIAACARLSFLLRILFGAAKAPWWTWARSSAVIKIERSEQASRSMCNCAPPQREFEAKMTYMRNIQGAVRGRHVLVGKIKYLNHERAERERLVQHIQLRCTKQKNRLSRASKSSEPSQVLRYFPSSFLHEESLGILVGPPELARSA